MTSEVDPHATSEIQAVEFPVVGFSHKSSNKYGRWKHKEQCNNESDNLNFDENLGNKTAVNVEFEKQLDELAIWFENWSHDERCKILEHLILLGNYSQFQLLWTSTQPVLHRDFMYNSRERYPDEFFTPLSTEISRSTRQRLTRNRTIQRYHRAKSVYLRNEQDVKSHFRLLPKINAEERQGDDDEESEDSGGLDSPFRLPNLHHRRSLTTPIDHVKSSYENPKANWMTAMQVRRHLQADEGRVKVIDSTPNNATLLYRWFNNWSGSQRATFFRLALMKLDARQLYFVANFLSVRSHRDMLALLPSNLSHYILSFLTPTDLSNCSKVSTTWRKLCYNNFIWKRKCLETRMGVRPVCTPLLGGWRSSYKEDKVMKRNWREGKCHVTELAGHVGSVLSVAIRDDLLVSGGKDNTVRVWNLDNCKLIQTFTGHQKGVWSVAIVSPHMIASGSYDRTVKVWRLGSHGACLRTLFGHQGPVWTMVCKKHFLASGSHDRTVKLWDMRHCLLHRTLKGHGSAVFAMDADDNMQMLFTGSADRSIRIWRVSDGQCVRVIWTGEKSSIMSLSCQQNLLASASGGRVTIWEHSTGTRMRTYKAHKKRIENVKLRITDSAAPSGVLITAGKDGKIKYWNIYGRGKVNQLQGHGCHVNAVTADATRIVSASYDETIRVWDFSDLTR